jgi:hypothetical protein
VVSRRRLSARAVSLGSERSQASDLGAVTLRPAGYRPLQLPRTEPDWWESAVLRLSGFGEHASDALRQLFVAPIRCYELVPAQPGARTVALLMTVREDKLVRLIVGILTVDLNPRKQAADWGHLEITAAALDDDAAREALFSIADQLTPESLAARDPDGPPVRAIVVGDLLSTQRAFLTRRLWAYGVRVDEFLEQPRRNQGVWARERVRLYGGDLVVLLQAGCGSLLGVLLSEIRGGIETVLLAESDPDLLALELDEMLRGGRVDEMAGPGDVGERGVASKQSRPVGVAEAAQRIRALPDDEGRFVLTENCVGGLEEGLLADPLELAEQSERFKALALRWSRTVRSGGLGGDIATIARTEHELILARSDEPMRRAKLDKFEFEGTVYSRETHIKVTDHTSANRVARIYFTFDDQHEPPRVIVDHIGSKISPYVKR